MARIPKFELGDTVVITIKSRNNKVTEGWRVATIQSIFIDNADKEEDITVSYTLDKAECSSTYDERGLISYSEWKEGRK